MENNWRVQVKFLVKYFVKCTHLQIKIILDDSQMI